MKNQQYTSKVILLLCSIAVFYLASCKSEEMQQFDLLIEEYVDTPEPLIRIYRTDSEGKHLQLLTEFDDGKEYWVSPNGNYLALFSYRSHDGFSKRILKIIELETNTEIGQLSNVGYLFPGGRELYLTERSVVWSPLEDKVLFERNAEDGTGNILWVYDLKTKSEKPITTGETLDREPAWSSDDEYVAFVMTNCLDDNENCSQIDSVWEIATVNVENQELRILTDFFNESISFEPDTGDQVFCNLQWSPDNKYIAFENQCLRSGPILNRHRVFIVHVQDGWVEEAAKFDQPYAYSYSYDWEGEDRLLIGYSISDYLNFRSFLRGGLKTFSPQSDDETSSVELLGFQGSTAAWNPNDKSEFIAFSLEPIFDVSQNGQQFASSTTLLGNLSDGNMMLLSESRNLPHGLCRENIAYWSPDGKYIVYSSIGKPHKCNQNVLEQDVYVYSVENGDLVNVSQSLEGISEPIGWTISNTQ